MVTAKIQNKTLFVIFGAKIARARLHIRAGVACVKNQHMSESFVQIRMVSTTRPAANAQAIKGCLCCPPS